MDKGAYFHNYNFQVYSPCAIPRGTVRRPVKV